MQNINIDNIDRDIFLFELSSYICNRQLRHVLLSSYVRVYVRSTVFLFFLSKKKKKKKWVYFRICNPLGIFRRNFIHNGKCMYCFPSTSVYMSVHLSAFSFVKNDACTLEFVNHLGN